MENTFRVAPSFKRKNEVIDPLGRWISLIPKFFVDIFFISWEWGKRRGENGRGGRRAEQSRAEEALPVLPPVITGPQFSLSVIINSYNLTLSIQNISQN